ncbi:oligosaccharide flippase family protein [Patescibacteria group bacterium]|nr:oligosaccharide flippase family protein [Patescibacteria group bacterium]
MSLKEKIYQILIKTQSVSQTDNVYLGKQLFFVGINYAVIFIFGLLTSVAFARYVSKEAYGQYQYLFSILAILGVFSLRGIAASLTRSIARGFEGSFLLSIKKRLAWAAAGSIVALIMAGYYFFKDNAFLAVGCLLIAALMPIYETADMYQAYLEGKKDFRQRAKLNILAQIIYSSAILAVIYFRPQVFPIFIVSLLFSAAVKWLFNLSIIKKTRNKETENDVIKYGKHLSLITVVNTVAQQLNKILVFHFLGPIDLAIFSFANLPQSQATNALANLRTIAYPKISEKDKDILIKAWFRKLLLLTFFIALGTIFYLFIAPFLFKIFFPNYMSSVKYSQILFLLVLFFPVSFLPLILQAQKKQKELYRWNISTSLLEIVLFFLLIPPFGLWGLIYAEFATKAVSCLYGVYLFKKVFAKNL